MQNHRKSDWRLSSWTSINLLAFEMSSRAAAAKVAKAKAKEAAPVGGSAGGARRSPRPPSCFARTSAH
jgi:hypothetical protein